MRKKFASLQINYSIGRVQVSGISVPLICRCGETLVGTCKTLNSRDCLRTLDLLCQLRLTAFLGGSAADELSVGKYLESRVSPPARAVPFEPLSPIINIAKVCAVGVPEAAS